MNKQPDSGQEQTATPAPRSPSLLRRMRVRIAGLGALGVALWIVFGGSAVAAGFLAIAEYGVRYIPMASAPSNCTLGRDCSWVSSADDNLYFQHANGSIERQTSSAPAGAFAVGAYGALCNDINDDTAAIQAAVTACEAAKGGTVYLPTGACKVTGTITMHRGTRIKGAGTQGSNPAYGSSIKHYANSTNLFVWDGTGTTVAAGTGGGLEDVFIAKAQTYAGGDAIFLTSTDDNHRPGEMVFRNVLIGGENNSALWSRAFHVDGSANTTAGGRGIRSIYLEKVRAASCDGIGFVDKCFHFTQVTHLVMNYIELDPVGGAGTPGMTFDGNYDDIFIPAMEVNGDTVFAQPPDGAYNPNVYVIGRSGSAFTNNATTLVGEAHVITASLTNLGNSFHVVNAGVSSYSSGALTNIGLTTVQDTATPLAGSVFKVRDNPGNIFLDVPDNGPITIKPNGADGASAAGLVVNTIASWSNSGAKLLRLLNSAVEKFFVRYDGLVSTVAGYVGPTIGPSSSQQHTLPAVASDTICLLAASQTLTTKTLTSPTLTTPVINGATSSGSTAIDLSGSTATFSTPTGVNTFGGSSNTFTNGITAPSATLTAGTGSQTGKAPVTIYSDTTVTASVTSGETDGSSYTMPANTLSTNGQMLKCQAAWTHAANTNSTTYKLYFNGIAIINNTNASSNDVIGSEIRFIRTSSSSVTYLGITQSPTAGYNGHRGTSAFTAGSTTIIKISVTGATTNGDLSTNFLRCEWWPN